MVLMEPLERLDPLGTLVLLVPLVHEDYPENSLELVPLVLQVCPAQLVLLALV